MPSRLTYLVRAAAFGAVLASARAQTDYADPWDPAVPLPQFITHTYFDPAAITAISKFRSDVGHVFVDNYEYAIGQSLKNYYVPLSQYYDTNQSLALYAPASCTVFSADPDGQILSNGDFRGYQVSLVPDAYPMFGITLFHVNLAAGIVPGTHLNSGDPIGYADMRESVNFDMAVVAIWNLKPLVQNLDPGAPLTTPSDKYVSAFDVMTDDVFAAYAPYGLTDRSSMIVSLAYRDAHAFSNGENTPNGLDPNEYFIYPPYIVTQPVNQYISPGYAAELFTVPMYDEGPVTYQWRKNGVPIPGATSMRLEIPGIQASDMGFYTATVTTPSGSVDTAIAIVTVETGGSSRLVDLSAKGYVPPGGQLMPGLVLRGAASKPLLFRAVGPALGPFGIADFLPDPELDVLSTTNSALLFSNDNWSASSPLTAALAATGAFPFAPGSKDAELAASVPGDANYSVRVTSSDGTGSGIALAEVYDTEALTSPTQLADVSILGFTGPGDQNLTAGFVIGGDAPKQVLIRVVGPGLAAFGVGSSVADPQLALVLPSSAQIITSNSGWSSGGQMAALQAAFTASGAFPLSAGSSDAAVTLQLPPGSYSVQASSVSGGSGNVMVEVYDLDPPPN